MNVLPAIANLTDEIRAFLRALEVQKQESRLFQFLNGLDDCYAPQRSQILMTVPLPTVEMVCSLIQQEESQKSVLNDSLGHDISVMYNKSVIGYPKWHTKHRRSGVVSQKGGGSGNTVKWTQNKGNKMVNVVQTCDANQEYDNVVLSAKQLEQLLKMLPATFSANKSEQEELNSPFSGMVSSTGMALCYNVQSSQQE
ncbi:hypothetical protein AgCh_007577 [Apium graveolens]